MVDFRIIVDLRINETRQTGAVENRTYRGGVNVVRGKPHLPGWHRSVG